MSYFADLSPCSYFGAEFAENLRAIGWLSRDELYAQGEVSEAFFKRLCQLLQNPWNPFYFMGYNECEFCHFTRGYGGNSRFRDYDVARQSNKNLFIPGDSFIYAAPELIAHYIDSHNYCPPEEFCVAVMKCPEMRSVDYLKAMLKNGGKDLFKSAKTRYKVK